MDTSGFSRRFPQTLGVFLPAMAISCGVSPAQLEHARRVGQVRRVVGRALMDASISPTPAQRAVAAHLTWPDAIICLRTAAVLHGLPLPDDGLVHALVPDGRKPVLGVVPHRWSVRPVDVSTRRGFPVTDRLTTLADCLGRLPTDDAWGLLAWMWTRELITADEIEAQLADRWHLYGVVRLRRMLMAVRRGALSEGEISLHEFLDAHGFTGWFADRPVTDRSGRIVARVDVLFPDQRLVLEFDGLLAHGERSTARDAARDAELAALGYVVMHVDWWQVHDHPFALKRAIKAALTAPPDRREGC